MIAPTGPAGRALCQAVPVSEQHGDEQAWEQRLAEAWASIDRMGEPEFLALIEELVAELPPDSATGLFERAASLDSTGHPDRAVPLYQQALTRGLTGERRRRAVIQLASSLRNLGRAAESVELLTAELDAGSDHLDDAVRGFLALALVEVGRDREAVSLALRALAPHLPRYQRSLATYGRLLTAPLTLRPTTREELAARTAALIESYAQDLSRAGRYSGEDARTESARQLAELLPDGIRTADMLFFTAEVDGDPVGWIWLCLPSAANRRTAAWVNDVLIEPEHRGKGYGRAIMTAAEAEVAARGVDRIALNVFAHNTPARTLYESLGYEVTAQQMAKTLSPSR
jgi:GNAT superfamily N-acetyltransferase